MFCNSCGAEIAEGSSFCSSCGAKIIKSENKQMLAHAKCTSCGAGLQVDPNLETAICPFCGDAYIDENHEKVEFLGKSFIMPNSFEINEYRNLMNTIAKAYTDVNSTLQRRIDELKKHESEQGNQGFWIQMEFWDDISGRGDGADVIAEAMEYAGIDVCPYGDDYDNYSKRTTGYRSMVKLADALEDAARNIYYQRERDVEYGQQTAYRNAASNITGMRYGIITNSAVDLLFYNAVSNATLKSQAKKADKQYAREAGAAAGRAYSAYARQLSELYYDQFLPAASRCISIWINEVTERAVSYETRNDHPVYSEIKDFNPQESKIIVDQITANTPKSDAISKLQQAFEKCPFDSEIYIKAAQVGAIDIDALDLAFSYNCHVRNEVVAELENFCKNNLADFNVVSEKCDILVSCFYRETWDEALKSLYSADISLVTGAYKELSTLAIKNEGLLAFIQKRLPCGKDCETFTEISIEKLEKEVVDYIEDIRSRANIEILIRERLVDINSISVENLTDLDSINKKYVEIISPKVVEYNGQMKESKARFLDSRNKFENEIEKKRANLEAMRKEKEELPVLRFKRKKGLETLIQSQHEELEAFEKAAPKFNWC